MLFEQCRVQNTLCKKELKFPHKIVADRCYVEEGRQVGQCTKATAGNTFGVSCLMGGKELSHFGFTIISLES